MDWKSVPVNLTHGNRLDLAEGGVEYTFKIFIDDAVIRGAAILLRSVFEQNWSLLTPSSNCTYPGVLHLLASECNYDHSATSFSAASSLFHGQYLLP